MLIMNRMRLGIVLGGLILLLVGMLGYAADTTTTLTSSKSPSSYGEEVTFTATVAVLGGGTEVPSGTVTFYDYEGTVTLGAENLSDTAPYVAEFVTSSLAVGDFHKITAAYAGDGDTSASTSGILIQVVNRADTTVSITTVDPEPSEGGALYAVSGTVLTAVASGAGIPTGMVTVDDGEGQSCTSAVNETDGTWSCALTALDTGARTLTLTATYGGDVNFNSDDGTVEHDVTVAPPAETETDLASDPNPSTFGELVTFTATVDPAPSGGMVVFKDAGTSIGSAAVDPTDGTAVFATDSLSVGTHPITAVYLGSDGFAGSTSNTVNQLVQKIATTTTLTSDLSTAVYHEPVTLTAAVTTTSGGNPVPTGTITFKDGATEIGTGAVGVSGEAFLTTSSLTIGAHNNITAVYTCDGAYDTSTSAAVSVTIGKRDTETRIEGSDTPLIIGDTATFTVLVSDVSPGTPSVPTGTVSISHTGSGSMSPSSPLTLGDDGRVTFSYTPADAATTPHVFTATYNGDSTHNTSTSDDFDQAIITRALDVQLICSPVDAFINQPISCTVILSDDTTAGTPVVPDETYLALSDDRWIGPTRFSAIAWTTSGGDRIGTFTYTPAAWDTDADQADPWVAQSQATATITATYAGSPEHRDAVTLQPLTVRLRPTEVHIVGPTEHLLVYQQGVFTATILDIAGMGTDTPPLGVITVTPSLAPIGESLIAPPLGVAPSQVFTYVRLGLGFAPDGSPVAGDYDSLHFVYAPIDGIHEGSDVGFAQALIRRPTETTLSNCLCTPSGVICFVDVVDHPDNPGPPLSPPAPAGDLYTLNDDDEDGIATYVDVGDAPTPPGGALVSVSSDLLVVNVTVQYHPTDRIYQKSTGSENVNRSDCMPDPDPSEGDASLCDAGCGEGGVDVEAIVTGLTTACLASQSIALILETAMLFVDPTPDPIAGAGCIVITGATIPTSDIAATIIGLVKTALQTYNLIACTDNDGDGIPDVVEEGTTKTNPFKVDSDSDAMGDSDEIEYCAGYYGGTLRPNPNNPDSDSDGLKDGYEMEPFNTDVCVADTDCDGLPDGIEVACRTAPLDANGFYRGGDSDYPTDTFAAQVAALGLGYAVADFPTLFADPRDQPNPREWDTDGDGLDDNVEFGPGDLATGTSDTSYSPYVNDPDSDGDGLLDGWESSDGNATWNGTVVGTGANVTTGETHLCLADTDGDGLLDGEEEGLFGHGVISVHSPLGTDTIAGLDWDSDDDYLSDYEEVNVYNTNPLDCDSDGDGVADSVEIATWDATINGRLQAAYDAAEFDASTLFLGYFALNDGLGASADSRNYADANAADTDGDGITDDLEIAYGCNCGSAGAASQDGYVNDDDSDDDGLQDGYEWNLSGDGSDVAAAGDASLPAPRGNNGELDDDDVCCICDPDSDGDGLSDGEEVHIGTDPLDWDSDDDGLSDREELQVYFTDPNDPDTDHDTASGILPNRPVECTLSGYDGTQTSIWVEGYSVLVYEHVVLASDGEEALSRTGVDPFGYLGDQSDPLSKDTDGDGIGDEIEFKPGCNCGVDGAASKDGFVNDDDSDDDGLQDGPDSELHLAAWDPADWGKDVSVSTGNDGELHDDFVCAICDYDSDGDGLSDGEEVHIGTDPLDWDSDDDGLSDLEELQIYFTDPNNDDTDGDGADGNIAARNPTISPQLIGHSGDGTIAALSDCEEAFSGTSYPPFGNPLDETDPLQLDTDGDGLGDAIEFKVGCSCGTTDWCDCPADPWAYADPNYYGVVYDPMRDGYANSFDSDGDGLRDDLDIGADVAPSNGNDGELYDDDTHSICDYDSDGDGLSDGEEYHTGTDWLDWDSDDDGLSDYEEVRTYFTDPNDDDTDDDQAEGNIAARVPTIDPKLLGHSGDGTIVTLSDCEEAFSGTGYPPFGNPLDETDPLQVDTDGDGLTDAIEFKVGCSCGTTDWCDCPADPWAYADPNYYGVVYDPIRDGYANSSDSDEDGLRDGEDIHEDLVASLIPFPGIVFTRRAQFIYPDEVKLREQQDDGIHSICDPDSDGDGLLDGEEFAIGTDWLDWDTDDDGRNDWHEHTGGGPIPTDPFDPDTDDDGLLDSAEVFGTNNTNPANADTDGDGLCDGGAGTPYMMDWFNGDTTVLVNPLCKSCATPGLDDCGAASARTGSLSGIGDHPNRMGFGEDQDGDGAWDSGETDPNQYDTDGDAIADGIERLAFSTSRQHMIPTKDLLGRPILVTYPEANNIQNPCGCLDPLNADSDGDGLSDGYEDANHDGNFDFLPSDFDIFESSVETSLPDPEETNPCEADTDHDGLTDWEERFQRQPLLANPPLPLDNDGDGLIDEDPVDGIDNDLDGLIDEDPAEGPYELTFNPTNPLDHDTDNDWLLDGEEVYWDCVAIEYTTLDNDSDGLIDEDPIDGLDNDGDGLIDEDPVDFWVRFVPMLDPTNRDSDSDGFIDGLDEDPCNSEMLPLVEIPVLLPVDSDGDGFADDDEEAAGTHPNSADDHPAAYCAVDVDFDGLIDDRIWLEPGACCGEASAVVIDLDCNVLIDLRIAITSRNIKRGDFDGDGYEDDIRYTVEYILSNYRTVQLRGIATIDDYNGDLVIDWVIVERK